MILWHLGGGLVTARLLFGRHLDLRLVALGALLPDILDKPVGRVIFRKRFDSGRLLGHSLLAIAVAASLSRRYRSLGAVTAGMLTHLLLDAIWVNPEVALWPACGSFPARPVNGRWWHAFLPLPGEIKFFEELAGLVMLAALAADNRRSKSGHSTVAVTLDSGRTERD